MENSKQNLLLYLEAMLKIETDTFYAMQSHQTKATSSPTYSILVEQERIKSINTQIAILKKELNVVPEIKDVPALIAGVEKILDGIDRGKMDNNGWWFAPAGKEFGVKKLQELITFLKTYL